VRQLQTIDYTRETLEIALVVLEQTGIKFSFGIALVSQTPLFGHIFGIADRWLRRTEALQQPPAGTHQTTFNFQSASPGNGLPPKNRLSQRCMAFGMPVSNWS